MNAEELEKVRKNLTKEEKQILSDQFGITYKSLQNILSGYRKRNAEPIFIAAAKLINERKKELNAAARFIQSL
jgi:hypothetical protein